MVDMHMAQHSLPLTNTLFLMPPRIITLWIKLLLAIIGIDLIVYSVRLYPVGASHETSCLNKDRSFKDSHETCGM